MDMPSYLQEDLKEEKLRYISCNRPGFLRQGKKKNFSYYNLKGQKIEDKKILERINNLRIPPAWRNVWICPTSNGHIQATGNDERDRKQYIYHDSWRKICQENKFSKMISFGLNLPKIRGRIKYDIQEKGMGKKKILATVIWLLEHTFIRVGNEEYAEENNSFGLTTLRNKHAKAEGSKIIFQFKGKSNVFSNLEVTNPTIVKTIKKCIELPGYELFQFIDQDGSRHVIDSEDVNDFLKEVTNGDFSAKDFRTWGATYLTANNLYKKGQGENKKTLKENITETIKKVAQHLNNTVSVCRKYYIHPSIFNTYQNQILVPHFERYANGKLFQNGLHWKEFALVRLLQKYP